MGEIACGDAARRVDHPHFGPLCRNVEDAFGIAGQKQALDAQRKADAGRRRTAERFHEPVVAAAAADRVLCGVEAGGAELERGAGVVVEAAHELVLDLVVDPQRVQTLAHPLEVGRRGCSEIVGDPRGVRGHGRRGLALGVQDAQRVARNLVAVLRVHIASAALQVAAQRLAIGHAGADVAHRVHQQWYLLQPDRAKELSGEGDDLHIGIGIVGAERLRPDLVELAVAAGLGRLVAEERPLVPHLPRRGGAVLGEGAAYRGRALGPQRQVAVAAVEELVHLLADHVGALADAGENAEVLEDRRLQVAESGTVCGCDEGA